MRSRKRSSPSYRREPRAVTRLGELSEKPLPEAAAELLKRYRAMLGAVGLLDGAGPYNLLATRRWMMLVPRARECFQGISVNALGFAGSLFVRDQRQLGIIRDCGPMTVLTSVAVPAGAA